MVNSDLKISPTFKKTVGQSLKKSGAVPYKISMKQLSKVLFTAGISAWCMALNETPLI